MWWLLSNLIYPGTATLQSSRKGNYFRETFANSFFIFRETHFGQQCLLEGTFITCQITRDYHGSLLDSPVNMQLAPQNPFSGQTVAD